MDNIEGKQQWRLWETGVLSLVWVFSLCACVNIPMFSSVPLEPLFTLGPGTQKQHKQNNSNNNNKMNSIHISMEQHCPGGLTLAGQPSHVRSGLRYLAVGCCDKASRVVDITPHHIVGEVRLQDKVLGVDLEL